MMQTTKNRPRLNAVFIGQIMPIDTRRNPSGIPGPLWSANIQSDVTRTLRGLLFQAIFMMQPPRTGVASTRHPSGRSCRLTLGETSSKSGSGIPCGAQILNQANVTRYKGTLQPPCSPQIFNPTLHGRYAASFFRRYS